MSGLASTESPSNRGMAQPSADADLLASVAARHACRAGMAASTAGVANGFVQGNLAILPEKLAASFHRFCQLNPKPCPVIGMSDVGDPRIPILSTFCPIENPSRPFSIRKVVIPRDPSPVLA